MSGTYDTNYAGYKLRKFRNQSFTIEEVEYVMEDFLDFTDEKTDTAEEMDLIRKYVSLYMEKKQNRAELARDEQALLNKWIKSVKGE